MAPTGTCWPFTLRYEVTPLEELGLTLAAVSAAVPTAAGASVEEVPKVEATLAGPESKTMFEKSIGAAMTVLS